MRLRHVRGEKINIKKEKAMNGETEDATDIYQNGRRKPSDAICLFHGDISQLRNAIKMAGI